MNKSSIVDAIGNTPLIYLDKLTSDIPARVAVKLEFMNPGGSIKDRMAYHIIRKGMERGDITPETTIIEVTSGNTGTSLAMLGALYGLEVILVVSSKVSAEKVATMKALGADVVKVDGSFHEQEEATLKIGAERGKFFYVAQSSNTDNAEAHYLTTGPEIWRDTKGKVTHWVAGIGTGGTLMGTCRFLKEMKSSIKCIGVDPKGSVIYPSFKNMDGFEYSEYQIEGIGSDFVPPLLDFGLIDNIVQVDDIESFRMSRELALREGIFGGGSSGANILAAFRIASNLTPDNLVVTVIPDSGYKYITKIYNDEWLSRISE